MTVPKRTKQPAETIDYPVSFARWARGRTDAAASFEVVMPPGITLASSSLDGWVVWLVISGGTAGQSYKITVRLTTDASPAIVKETEFVLQVREV
jgi:hypothetical protein